MLERTSGQPTSQNHEKALHEDYRLTERVALRIRDNNDEDYEYFRPALVTTDEHGKEHELSLEEFAPDYMFEKSARFGMHRGARVIWINLEQIRANPRNIIALFHELGHVTEVTKKGLIGHLYKATYNLARRSGAEQVARFGVPMTPPLVIQDERDAWAEALRIARICRDRGFDVLPVFNSREELSQFLHDLLLSYEKDASLLAEIPFILRLAEALFVHPKNK